MGRREVRCGKTAKAFFSCCRYTRQAFVSVSWATHSISPDTTLHACRRNQQKVDPRMDLEAMDIAKR